MFSMMLLPCITDGLYEFSDLLFKVAYAFGMVGLGTGITSDLLALGQLILILTIIVGKLGPLTVGLTVAQHTERELYRFPVESVVVG